MVELPELPELPELLPLELPEPMPLPEPELGDGVVLGEVVVELPEPLPLAPAPDLLKWASHSERDTTPSLFVSTAEKLGAEALVAAGGEEDDLSLLVLLDDELCATATLDNANSAAAVAALTSFKFSIG